VFPTAGKADEFIQFFQDELIPMLKDRYRMNDHRCVVGWSFSGLFAAYTALSDPELFRMHLCISPAVWWDNDLVLERMQNMQFDKPKDMFFSLGTNEMNGWVGESTQKLLDYLKANPKKNLTISDIKIPNVGHTWGMSEAINKGLLRLYANYIPGKGIEMNSMVDITSYYNQLSKIWGYQVIPPEKVFINLGTAQWSSGKSAEGIKTLQRGLIVHPLSSQIPYYLARLKELENEKMKSLEYYQAALRAELQRIVPNQVNVRIYKSAICDMEGQ